METSKMRDWNRDRAFDSYQGIKPHQEKDEEFQRQLLATCRKLPKQIKENGLVDVLAYYSKFMEQDKKENGQGIAGQLLGEWLFHHCFKGKKDKNVSTITNVIRELMKCEFTEYNLYTKEAIQYSLWLKRNAEGMIRIKE